MDKVLHFAGAFIIAGMVGPGAALGLAIVKEAWDFACACGAADIADFAASLLGVLAAAAVL